MAKEISMDELLNQIEYEDLGLTTIEDVQAEFTEEQKSYIDNTPAEQRRVQKQLGIHFHQLQEPVSFAIIVPKKKDKKKEITQAPVQFEKEQEDGRKKPKKVSSHKGYPKEYFDPTDREFEPKDGKTYVYFNIEKSLRKYHLIKLTKIIPISKLEKWTYDKPLFDKFAQKQHNKVEKLNALTADQQFKRDIKVKLIIFGACVSAVLAVGMYIKGIYIPNRNFENGGNLMAAEKYDEAYHAFAPLGTKNNAHVYAKYCEGQMQLKTEHYDQAKECFTLLLDYQNLFADSINIEKLVQRCDYLKAKDLYSEGQFADAKALFKSVYQYEDATTYYYKCSIEIADSYYVQGDYYTAIDSMYEAGNAGYADAHDRLLNMADELYNSGMTAYLSGDYETAVPIFEFLSDYKFKNSKSMLTQCSYSYAMANFEEGDYTAAETSFNKISQYKDSLSLAKECVYNTAQKTYYDNPVKAIRYYDRIKDFRDTNSILTNDRLALYGRWNITELNGTKMEPVEFSFYDGGLFKTQIQISGVAISTEATPYSYVWINDHFSAIDNSYEIYIEKVESPQNTEYSVNVLEIVCNYGDNTYRYKCERVMSYLEMLKSDNTVSDTEESTLTLNQQIEKEVQEYIKKKTDGYIYIGMDNVDVTGKNTRMINDLGKSLQNEQETEEAPE